MKFFLFLVLSMTLIISIISSCAKEATASCFDCLQSTEEIDELTLKYPLRSSPGTFTIVGVTLNGEISYPLIIHWYANGVQYPLQLQKTDTLTAGVKEWYSFNYPQLYNASPFNKGPYMIRCTVSMKDREGILAKTISIASDY